MALSLSTYDATKHIRPSRLHSEIILKDHLVDIEDLAFRYDTDLKTGLTTEEANDRLLKNGLNQLKQMKPPSMFKLFCENMFANFAILLWIGAILSFVCYGIGYAQDAGDSDQLYIGILLILVILVTGFYGFYQESMNVSVMESFKKMLPRKTKVMRNSEFLEIDTEYVVLGDIVVMEGGGLVPADVRLIEVNGMKVDNSSLTGECNPLSRNPDLEEENPLDSPNMVFFGTVVVEGTGTGMVIATGDNTYIGNIAGLTATISKETIMKKELRYFIYVITGIALVIGVIFFALALLTGYSILDAVLFFIAIAIANVPEGLLVTLTACLTITGKKLAKKNCLVKSLQAVETLGATSVICSDKTGTLTQNKMTIVHMYYNNQIVDVHTRSYYPDSSTSFSVLCRVGILCNNAHFHPDDSNLAPEFRRVVGGASEVAIFQCMERIVGDVMEKRFMNPKVCEIPFNSTNKFQVTIVIRTDGRHLLTIKGAPEVILSKCTRIHINSATQEIASYTKSIRNAIFELSNMGERVLGFADYPLPVEQYPEGFHFDSNNPNFPLDELRFVGLMAMLDPPKPGVYEAVQQCRTAGIRVCMVTGDHPVTAVAVGKMVGIISPERRSIYDIARKLEQPIEMLDEEQRKQVTAVVVTGKELLDLEDDDLDALVTENEEIIFARTTPTQKLNIVEAFQRSGEIVAVTGDGVNDSAAMKQADIGVAMGITGSDVTKEAADMVLLDDNFATIVKGIEEGRIVYDNLKKSIAYILTSNCPEIVPFILYVSINIPTPLTIIAIIIIDIGTDLWPGLSLAYEKGEADIMYRKPRDTTTERLVNSRLIAFVYLQIGIIQTLASLSCYFTTMAQYGFYPQRLVGIRVEWEDKTINDLKDSYGLEWSYSARKELENKAVASYFLGIVVTQIADAIICKSRRLSIFSMGMHNWVMNGGLIFEVVLAVLLVYVPHVNTTLRFSAVHWTAILPAIPYAVLIIVYDEVRRYFIRTRPKGWAYRETYF